MKILLLVVLLILQGGKPTKPIIQNLDLESFILSKNHKDCVGLYGAQLETDHTPFWDLTGDGKPEAIVNGTSCTTNHMWTDVHVVLTLRRDELLEIPVGCGSGASFKKIPWMELHGEMRLAERGGALVAKDTKTNRKVLATFRYNGIVTNKRIKGNAPTGRFEGPNCSLFKAEDQ